MTSSQEILIKKRINFLCFLDFKQMFLKSPPMLPTNFQVNWPFSSGEVKNTFSKWRPWRPSWVSDLNTFSYFLSTNLSDRSYQVSSQVAFWFRRISGKDIFKMAATAAILV